MVMIKFVVVIILIQKTLTKTKNMKSSKKEVICFKCGNTGHYANQCYVDNEGSDESYYSDDYWFVKYLKFNHTSIV